MSSLAVGLLMYAAYGIAHDALTNLGLAALCAFIAWFLPFYSKLSNKAEEKVQLRTASVTLGRLARFAPQFVFNVVVFAVFHACRVLPAEALQGIGGIPGTAAMTTAASQGVQYLALAFANREIGDRNRNIMIALAANILVTCLGTLGVDWAKAMFLVFSALFSGSIFALGALSDLRAVMAPKGGVAIFFGTFNPFHKTHLRLISEAIERRGLSKVYLHSTVVPKLHRDALERGEIVIANRDRGMRIYEKTAKSDPHVNYFPTGAAFFEYETRRELMKLAIEEAGLTEKVEVLDEPKLYEHRGFYGIIALVKQRSKGTAIHGIHGSDLGGMWIRSIYDECGWIYPYPVRRVDSVSATAVRKGVLGLTPSIIEAILQNLRAGSQAFQVGCRSFRFEQGILTSISEVTK
jgi:nicotinic acid mononucleotide adenylyltransferase